MAIVVGHSIKVKKMTIGVDIVDSGVGHDSGVECVDECADVEDCLLYTSPSPRDRTRSRMPSSA